MLFKEMLEEFEQMKEASDIELEAFSSEVLANIEKTAAFKSLVKAVGKPLGSGAKAAGNVTASGTKKLFKAQHTYNKALFKDPFFAGMVALPVVAGKQNIGSAVKENVIPMYSQLKQESKNIRNLKHNTRIPKEMFRSTKDMPYKGASVEDSMLEKVALFGIFDNKEDTKIKDAINSAGVSLGAGAGAYYAYNKYQDAKETSNIARGLSIGVDKAITNIGKSTAKSMSKDKPITKSLAQVLVSAGKTADKLMPREDKLRLDYSSLGKSRPGLGNLGIYLGLVGGATLAEEYLADRALVGLGLNKDPEEIYKKKQQQHNNRYHNKQNRYASREESLLEKVAVNKDTKRLIADRIIKPSVGASTFLLSLSLLSNAVDKKIYGVGKDKKDKKNKDSRIVIDLTDLQKSAGLNKSATYVDILNSSQIGGASSKKKILDKTLGKAVSTAKGATEEKTKMDRLKEKVDAKIREKAPGPVKKLDQLLADEEKYRYTGRKGLGHFVVEEVPYKAVEGLAYATPMAAIALMFNKDDARKAFDPLDSSDNTTRIIFETPKQNANSSTKNGEEKKASAELTREQAELERYKQEEKQRRVEQALKNITSNKHVVMGMKKKEEKLASDELSERRKKKFRDEYIRALKQNTIREQNKMKYMDPNKPVTKQPFLDGAKSVTEPRNVTPSKSVSRSELINLLRRVRKV